MKAPEPLAGAILSALRQLPSNSVSEILLLQTAWPQAVGDEIACRCHPVGYSRPVIEVEMEHEAWKSTLIRFTERITSALSKKTGLEVTELRVRLRSSSRPIKARREAPESTDPRKVTTTELPREMEEICAAADSTLSETLRRMLQAYVDAHT